MKNLALTIVFWIMAVSFIFLLAVVAFGPYLVKLTKWGGDS